MCSRITSLIVRAYKMQTANQILYKQHKTTDFDQSNFNNQYFYDSIVYTLFSAALHVKYVSE